MDLFSHLNDHYKNYLPKQGTVNYYGTIISYEKANSYLKLFLENIPWVNDTFYVAGKNITTSRKIAWFGDQASELIYFNTKKTVNM